MKPFTRTTAAFRALASAICIVIAAMLPLTADAVNINNGSERDANVKKSVKIDNFAGIQASSGIRIIYTQGKFNGKAQIATTESAAPYLKVYVKNGWLIAEYDTPSFKPGLNINGPTIITVTSPNLKKIDLSSTASVTVTNNITVSDALDIDLSSASKVDLKNVSCRKLDADLSSQASLTVGKISGEVSVDTSSASSVTIKAAECTKASADASSASKITIGSVTASQISADASSSARINIGGISAEKISAEASSASSITLNGKCNSLQKETSSAGKVNTSGLKVSKAGSGPTSSKKNKHHKKQGTLRVP